MSFLALVFFGPACHLMVISPRPPTLPPAAVFGKAGFFSFFPSIVLPMFLANVDQTIVAAALPTIAGDLGGAERISWIVVAYLIAAAVASPVYGKLGDIFGHKRLILVALVVHAAASTLCAVSTSVEMLVVARMVQGFAGGGLMTLSQALIGEHIPARERARYQSILSTTAVSSTAFGAAAGGWLTGHFGWRSIFLVGVPIGFAAMLLIRRLPPFEREREPFRFDALGLFLFVVFITSSLLALRQVQEWRPGTMWPSLALLALGGIAVVLLVRTEKRASHPLFPIPLFRHPAIWRADLMALCHGALLVSLVTFLPIYLRVGHGTNPTHIGLSLLPVTVGVPVGSIMTGLLIVWTGRTAIFPSLGLIVVALTLLAVGLLLSSLGVLQLSIVLGFCGLFMGTVMGVVQLTTQASVGTGMRGTAAASVQYSRSIGATLGTAIVVAVLFGTMTTTDGDAARMFADILRRGSDAISALPAARRAVVLDEIRRAFQAAFLTMAGFATVAMVLAWTLPLRRT